MGSDRNSDDCFTKIVVIRRNGPSGKDAVWTIPHFLEEIKMKRPEFSPAVMPSLNLLDASFAIVGLWLVLNLSRGRRRSLALTSNIHGPPSVSWLYGASEEISANGSAVTMEKWEKEYGSVFRVPLAVGSSVITILDTKALSQIFSKDGTVYVHPTFMKKAIASVVRPVFAV